jgi:WD40 repeat protein
VVIPTEVIGNRNKAVAIGSEGTIVVTGSREPEVCLWLIRDADTEPEIIRLSGHNSRVWTVALSPEERLIASSDEEGVTIVTDVKTRTVLHRILLDRPYERMKIKDVKGLNLAERAALNVLGAVD